MVCTLKKLLAATAAIAVFALPSARAETALSLTTLNSSQTVGPVTFATTDQQPTGTGVIQSFVRIGDPKDLVQGYNTDGGTPLNDKGGPWTHSVRLDSLAVQSGGTFRFLLDINQTGSNTNYNLNEMQLWVSTNPNLTNYSSVFDSTHTDGTANTGFGASATKVYDLDAGGDVSLVLNYSLNSGSGSGDMYAVVPTSLFSAYNPTQYYVYLFSAFGQPNNNNDGFEEWAALTGDNNPIPFGAPEPSALALAFSGLVASGFAGLRRYRRRGMDAA